MVFVVVLLLQIFQQSQQHLFAWLKVITKRRCYLRTTLVYNLLSLLRLLLLLDGLHCFKRIELCAGHCALLRHYHTIVCH